MRVATKLSAVAAAVATTMTATVPTALGSTTERSDGRSAAPSAASSMAGHCGVVDFSSAHYSPTSPHYDEWEFVLHTSETSGVHYHY